MFDGIIAWLIQTTFGGLDAQLKNTTNQITMSPADAFGTPFWNSLLRIGTSVVMPFAITILCYFMTAELYHVYCRSNGELDLQLVTTTVLKFVIPFVMITRSYDLIKIIFTLFNALVRNISKSLTMNLQGSSVDLGAYMAQIQGKSFIDQFLFVFQLAPLQLIMAAMGVVVMVIVYGRLFEMIIYWIFAPIPLATLVSQEYSQIGKNFIKMFCAIMLQGAIMLLVVVLYTLLAKNAAVDPSYAGAFQLVGYSAVLVFALVKTGSISKRMFGTF